MGELFAFMSAAGFSLTNVLVRKGLRPGDADNGLLITMISNVAILTAIVFCLALVGRLPEWSPAGIVWFAIAGLLTTFLGRGSTLASLRYVGPSRAAAVKNTSPVVSVLLALLLLDERLSFQSGVGIALAFIGLLVLGWEAFDQHRTRRNHPELEAVTRRPPEIHMTELAPGDDGRYGSTTAPSAAAATVDGSASSAHMLGLLLAILAAIFFGSGQVVRKVGLEDMPDPFVGAAIGAWVALCSHVAMSTAGGRTGALFRNNFGALRAHFWLAGLASTVGLLSFFVAIMFAPVSHVSVIASSETILTVVLAAIVFGRSEIITRRVVAAAIAVFLGTVLIALH